MGDFFGFSIEDRAVMRMSSALNTAKIRLKTRELTKKLNMALYKESTLDETGLKVKRAKNLHREN